MRRCSRLFNSLLGLVAEMQPAAAAGTPNLARSAGLQAGRPPSGWQSARLQAAKCRPRMRGRRYIRNRTPRSGRQAADIKSN